MALLNGRQLVRGLAFAGVATAGYAFGVTSDRAAAQPQPQPAGLPGAPTLPPGPGLQPQPKNAAPLPQAEPDRRVVAYIHGNIPITRGDLGDFLIARGGHEKLELLVNKRIIELEAERRKIVLTTVEMKAALEEDVRGLGITKEDFVKHILPKYGKSLYEWTEDVIRPRILLTKMCQGRVQVSDEDIQKAFENRFGERRAAKIITWNENDFRTAQKQWDEARKSDDDFDRVARVQADPNLASAGGQVRPIGKHPETENEEVHKMLYKLQPGELSPIFKVPAGFMCIKYVAPVPAEANVKLDEKMKEALRKEMFTQRLDREIPKCFKELKDAAQPQVYLKGPPSAAEFREGVNQIINQAGGVPTLPAAPTPPAPKP
ncbi:peptidylprolyl isomerase [Gemmata sp. JC717]|uniref:peptidylprolyl isomerase n=1 Tax=Gemmata algarum TaxID=2975278 RepID=UPI0021BB2E03|nr:peptidylprolyl isomerase [Gemmata algarum]MDY3553579.1 peptidylprolyl isomerase [Gemmata algarum]